MPLILMSTAAKGGMPHNNRDSGALSNPFDGVFQNVVITSVPAMPKAIAMTKTAFQLSPGHKIGLSRFYALAKNLYWKISR